MQISFSRFNVHFLDAAQMHNELQIRARHIVRIRLQSACESANAMFQNETIAKWKLMKMQPERWTIEKEYKHTEHKKKHANYIETNGLIPRIAVKTKGKCNRLRIDSNLAI